MFKNDMTLDQFKVLLYEFLWNREVKYLNDVESAKAVLHYNEENPYCVIKYYEAVLRLEDFKIFQRYLLEMLK